MLKGLQKKIHETSKLKGWWETPNIPEKMLMVHAELSEAVEEFRIGKMETYYNEGSEKPEGFGIELADAIIRLLDLAEAMNLDMSSLIKTKMDYNETRSYRHGGKKI